jgi:hypothetical protein
MLIKWLFGSGRTTKRRSRVLAQRGFRARPRLEELEARCLPSTWTPIGPAPQDYPITGGNPVSGRISALSISTDIVGGKAVETLYVGSASGGVLRSRNFLTAAPNAITWDNITSLSSDQTNSIDPVTGLGAGTIDVGSIAVIPGNLAANTRATVFVGTGEANQSGDGRYGSGILISPNGGDGGAGAGAWQLRSQATVPNPVDPSQAPITKDAFFRHSISKILIPPPGLTLSDYIYAAIVSDRKSYPATTTPTSTGRPDLEQDNGIYRSKDGGQTWWKITKAPTTVQPNTIGDRIEATDLEYTISPTKQVTLYAGVRSQFTPDRSKDPVGGIWYSTDYGDNWKLLPTPASNIQRFALAADHTPSAQQRLYYAYADGNNKLGDIAYSDISGTNADGTPIRLWNIITPTNEFKGEGQMDYNLAFGLLQPNAKSSMGRLYLGGQHKVMEYLPSTNKWYDLLKFDPQNNIVHADNHAIAFDSLGRMYLGNDGGLYRYTFTTSAAVTANDWEDLNRSINQPSLSTNQVYSIALNPVWENSILVGEQDNGTALTTDRGSTWKTVENGDTKSVIFDPLNANVAYALSYTAGPTRTDNYATAPPDFSSIAGGLKKFGGIRYRAMAVSPQGKSLLVASDDLISQTTDRTAANVVWTELPLVPLPRKITSATYARGAGNSWNKIVYIGTGFGFVYRLADATVGGGMWEDVTPKTPAGTPVWGTRRVKAIAADPGAVDRIFVTLADFSDSSSSIAAQPAIGQVYMREQAGAGYAWFNIGAVSAVGDNIPPNVPARSIVADPVRRVNGYPILYVGTDAGVYEGEFQGAAKATWTWIRYGGTELPNVEVDQLQIQRYPDAEVLAAATYGRGAWISTLSPPDEEEAVEGHAATNLSLGSFQDTSNQGTYPISIDWQDGSTDDSGTVTAQNGVVTVTGAHTFATPGTYDVIVTANPDTANPLTLVTPITVGDAALTTAGQTLSDTALHANPDNVVATFADANPSSTAADFTAYIAGGDGSNVEASVTLSNGVFLVHDNHTYTNPGSYRLTVTIFDNAGSTVASASATAVITGPVTIQAATNLVAQARSTFTGTVATFAGSSTATYQAQLNWGDGTQPTSGGVSFNDTSFVVSGQHIFASIGKYLLGITIEDGAGNALATLSETIVVGQNQWTGLGGTNNWNDPANWSEGYTPNALDNVIIPAGANVTLDSGSVTVSSLTVAGTLNLTGGSLSVAQDSSIANLDLSGGTLSGDGQVRIGTSLTWTGGVLTGTGQTVVANGATADLTAAVPLIMSGTELVNEGSATLETGTSLELDKYAAFFNYGTLVVSDGSAITTTATPGIFDNEGSVSLSTGSATIAVASTNGGTITAATGSMLTVQSSDFTALDGSSVQRATLDHETLFSGDGYTMTAANTTFVSTTFVNTGLLVLSGTTTLSGAATLHEIQLGSSGSSGQIAFSGDITLAGVLSVNILPGFTPSIGNSFTIFQDTGSGTVSGAFFTLDASGQPVALPEGATILTPDGQYALTITYVGGSSGHDVVLTCVILPAGDATTTTLDTPANSPSRAGQNVTLTAHVADASNPATSGTVTFFDGLRPMATVAVDSSGTGSFTTAALSRGSHSLTARYDGENGSYSPSVSSAVTQFVGTAVWTGAAGDSLWNNPENWNGDLVPGTLDDVFIGAGVTVLLGSGSVTVNNLTLNGVLNFTGGSLTVNGDCAVAGLLDWSGGSLAVAGQFIIDSSPAGGNVGGAGTLVLSGVTLVNQGDFALANSSTLDLANGATFVNDGDFSIGQGASLTSSTGDGLFDNEGTFHSTGSPMLVAQSVTLAFINGGTVYSNGYLTFQSSDFTMLDGSTTGEVAFAQEALHLAYGDSATIEGGSTFTDTTLDDGGKLVLSYANVNGNNTWDDVQFGDNLGGTGNVTITDEMDWTGGSLGGSGTITVSATALLDINASSDVLVGQALNTYGLTVVEGSGNVQINDGAVWENFPSGEIDLRADLSFLGNPYGNDGTLINDGLFQKSGGTGESRITSGLAFDNTGTVDVQTGTLKLQGGGTNSSVIGVESGATLNISGGYVLTSTSVVGGAGAVEFSQSANPGIATIAGTITAGQGIVIDTGAEIAGAATFYGNVANAGIIDVGGVNTVGVITINGDYTQTLPAQINFTLDGTTAGTGYSQLKVTGAATLDGTANINTHSGYTPAANSSYSLITFASMSGSFASVTNPFDPTYGSTAFTVTYTP